MYAPMCANEAENPGFKPLESLGIKTKEVSV